MEAVDHCRDLNLVDPLDLADRNRVQRACLRRRCAVTHTLGDLFGLRRCERVVTEGRFDRSGNRREHDRGHHHDPERSPHMGGGAAHS